MMPWAIAGVVGIVIAALVGVLVVDGLDGYGDPHDWGEFDDS